MNRTISKTVDLSKFQAVDQLTSPLYQLEVDGHTFEITVLRDKEPATVSGSVAARFIRPDGTTVSFTGSASGNMVSITLPQACYLYNGRFGMVVFVSGSGTTMALYACAGSVYKSTTDAIIDPDGNIPTLEELLAQIEACEDATAAANAASVFVPNIIAKAYSDSSAYAVGDYVTKDGHLYVCTTPISTRESWTIGHWAEVTAGARLTNVENECAGNSEGMMDGLRHVMNYENGTYILSPTPTPGLDGRKTRIRPSEFIYVKKGDVITISNGSTDSYINAICVWSGALGTATRVYVENSFVSTDRSYTVTEDGFFIVSFADATDQSAEIDPAKFNGSITVTSYAMRNQLINFKFVKGLSDGDDLNNLYESGWYSSSATHHYLNSPEGSTTEGQRFIAVYNGPDPKSNTYRVMEYYNFETGVYAKRIYYSSAWHSWFYVASKPETAKYVYTISNGDDLDSLYENGWYIIGATDSVLHSPEPDGSTGQRMIFVFSGSAPTATTYRAMYYFNYATNFFAVRFYYTSAWHGWITPNSLKYVKSLSNGDDLDSLYENGWYLSSYLHNYLNAPEPDGTIGQRIVLIFSGATPTSTTYRAMIYYNYYTRVFGVRFYLNSAWQKWKTNTDNVDTVSESFTPSAQASQGANAGTNIRVMSYNVARWNNDSATYLPDNKVFNLRKMLGKAQADIICLQEAYQYIDGPQNTGTKAASSYLFAPQYPYVYGLAAQANAIVSKSQKSDEGRVVFSVYGSNYRGIKWVTYTIGSKTLLIGSAHPTWNDAADGGTSESNIAARATQYEEIFKWLNGDITLEDYTTHEQVYAPTHTHSILCMDANSATDDDKSNLETLAASNDFILGNGGALGWFLTGEGTTKWALDNICVSDNVIINNIEAWTSWYNALYSDHCPLIADLTLI